MQLEAIGALSDAADSYAHAANLTVPAEMHVRNLQTGMERLREDLRKLYVEISGKNPWQ